MSDHEYLDALLRAEPFRSAGPNLRVIETHISWVILTGAFAYKIKKPVRLQFVDFSTVAKRRLACQEELRLNRRLAPEIYLEVVPITGSAAQPQLGGHGPPIDFAVRMHQFDPGAVPGEQPVPQISTTEIGELAALIARFHQGLPAVTSQPWGTPESVWQAIEDSLAEIARIRPDGGLAAELTAIGDSCRREFATTRELIAERRARGFVRECHGDLHLRNIVRFGQRLVPFDALEFDPALRWIDVLSEVAFLVMDLEVHDRSDLAFAFLNGYLALTGDYEGLPLLPLFLSYRALVRAKVRLLAPPGPAGHDAQEIARLIGYSMRPCGARRAQMILMCGVSGSGKSVLAGALSTRLCAIHVRSDIERKRMAGLAALERTAAQLDTGIYAPQITGQTYARLATLARSALQAGLSVLIDATNLRADQRQPFIRMAREFAAAVAIVYCTAPQAELLRRVSARSRAGNDPSEADVTVLRRQLARLEVPQPDEADVVLAVDTAAGTPADGLGARIAARISNDLGAVKPKPLCT
jgi:hypothetical protein